MDWFYTVEGQKQGPVTEEEFQWLVKDGVVTEQTLVWCLGMDEWKPYRHVPPVAMEKLPPRPLGPALVDGVRCAGCRGSFPPGEMIPLAGGHYCAACKPLAIQRLKEGVVVNHDASAKRQEYLKHEKSVRTVTLLFFLGGGMAVCVGISRIVATTMLTQGVGSVNGAIILLLGLCHVVVWFGLRRFQAGARIPAIVLSCVGLLGFPIATLFSIYNLTKLLQQKTKVILSDEYRTAIEQTPHIKCRASRGVWSVLFLFLLVIAIGVLYLYEKRVRHGQ